LTVEMISISHPQIMSSSKKRSERTIRPQGDARIAELLNDDSRQRKPPSCS
jgi:hypothetical protein